MYITVVLLSTYGPDGHQRTRCPLPPWFLSALWDQSRFTVFSLWSAHVNLYTCNVAAVFNSYWDPLYHVLNVPMHPEMCTLTIGIATFDLGKGWVVTPFYVIQETGKIPLVATSEAPCWVCRCLGGWTQDQQASTPAHLSLKYLDCGRKDTHLRGT